MTSVTHSNRRRIAQVGVVIALATLALLRGLALELDRAEASTPLAACPPNDSSPAVVGGVRCIAELYRSSRSGLIAACVVDPKAVAKNNPLYLPAECRKGSGVQAEGIAQARYIAQRNILGMFADAVPPGGVSANIQWEVTYPKSASTAPNLGPRRLDYIDYDRDDTDVPIDIVELRQRRTATAEQEAVDKAFEYLRDLPPGNAGRSKNLKNVNTFVDFYRVLVADCRPDGSVSKRVVAQYQTRSATRGPGVLMIDREDQETDCPRQGEPQLPPVPGYQDRSADLSDDIDDEPPRYYPAPGLDEDEDGADDFWEEFLKEHPELAGIPSQVPIPEPSTVPAPTPGERILVPVLVGVLIVAAVALCVAYCAAILPWLATLGLGLAAAETGSASIAAVLTALAGLVGLKALWNLWGDPHVVTFDRLKYDMQSVGEFHLLELPDAGIDVQARFRRAGTNVSVLDRIATVVNDRRVEVGGAFVKVDGVDLSLSDGQAYDLGDGAFVGRDASGYIVSWPGGIQEPLTMLYRGNNVGFVLPAPDVVGTPQGLLGNHDGTPSNDLALRDGTPLSANSGAVTIHGSYADSWRITDDESAFSYAANQSTATFTDRSFPPNVVSIGDFPEDMVAAATETCSQAGVAPGPQFDGCVIDMVVTGDDAYARSAALVTDVVVSADAQGFDPAGHLGVDFEGAVPPNFTSARYSADAATSRIAGPIFDKGGYRFYVRNVDRHDVASLDTDLYTFGPVAEDSRAQSVAVRINGSTRGSVLFDGGAPRLSGDLNGTVTNSGSGVTAAGKAFTRFHLHSDLGRLGESIDVEFVPDGFDGIFNTALGFDDIELALDIPPAQHLAVTEPFSAPTSAGPGSGTLETPGAADAYDFDVATADAGKAHVINLSGCTTALTLSLADRDTGAPVGRWPNTCTRITTPTVPAGHYTLTVAPYASAAAGSYSLQMLVRPDPQRFNYALGTVVSEGSPGPGAGDIETLASRDVYSFHTSGGELYFDSRSCFGGESYTLTPHDSDAVLTTGGCFDRGVVGLAAGDYDLSFVSNSGEAGTYGFQLFGIPVAPQDFGANLTLTVSEGVPADGAGVLETKLSVDRYTFSIPNSAPLYVDIQSCLDTGSLKWSLNNVSTGTEVDRGTCADRQTAALDAGTYRLTVSSPDEGRGAYALQAWLVPMAPQAFAVTVPYVVAPGQPAPGAGNLETKASSDVYSFTLPADSSALYLDQVTCSRPDLLTWSLINDIAGAAVTVANGTCEDRQIRQVARGNYRLVVAALGEHHGTYGFRIVPSDTGSPTMVHAPPPTAFYGQPVPIDVATSCADRVQCFVRLHYRTTARSTEDVLVLPAGSWTTVDLSPTGTTSAGGANLTTWKGAVPGPAVSTTGVDYYVTAGDRDHRNELPTAPPAPLGLTGELSYAGVSVAETPYFHVSTVSPPLLAHVTPAYAQADHDLPLELRATCSTGRCTATMHYRTSTGLAATELLTDPGWPKVTMTQTASAPLGDAGALLTFKGTIPASVVDTRGVDYYFDVTDTGTTSYWPGTVHQGYYAPTDGMRTAYQTVHVLEPPHIVHAPVMTTPYRAATPITATSNCPKTRNCTARLYYRTTTVTGDVVADSVLTEKDYTVVPMTVARVVTLSGNDIINLAATIPGSYADTRGIDYFFRVDDGSTTTWFPGTGQIQGYANVDGARVAFQHIRVLEAPHIAHMPVLATKALQPYTVTSQLTCATENCSLTLHWRNDLAPGEADPGWHDLAMVPTGVPTPTPAGKLYTFTGTIPGDKVTTRALAYYLEAHDGYVHDYAPGTSYWGAYVPLDGQRVDPTSVSVSVNGSEPVIGAFLVRVLEPPHLMHAPPTLAEMGRPLTLIATSNCSSAECPATLTWTAQDGIERSVAMTAVKQVAGTSLHRAVPGDVWEYRATIPAVHLGAPVRYRMAITDGYMSDTTPEYTTFPYQLS